MAGIVRRSLFELQVELHILAGIEGADRFGRALFLTLFGPDLVIVDHSYLGKAKTAVRSAGEALDIARLEILQEDGSSSHASIAVADNLALDRPLAKVLRLGKLRTEYGRQAVSRMRCPDRKQPQRAGRDQTGKDGHDSSMLR